MLSKTKSGEELNKLLLKDVEAINKALHLDKSSSRNSTSSPKSKPKEDNNSRKDKKSSSIWNWKPLKALNLSFTRNRKFNCSFCFQVHLIEGLPSSFDDSSICVHWKRRDEHLVTSPAKVVRGVAEFQEVLTYTCSIYGSRSGPHNSAKYEAKHILLNASVVGASEFDLGKHRVDLTRLLPLTLEDLDEEKSSGRWTTSFRLSGTAKGAVMNVSFGYVVVGDNTCATPHDLGSPNLFTPRQNSLVLMDSNQPERSVKRTGSLPNFAWQDSIQSLDEVKDLHEVLPSSKPERTNSVNILFVNFDEEKTCSPLHNKPELEFKENLEKLDACCTSDTESEEQEQEEIPGNEGKTCSPVHDKHEFDVFQEKEEIVKPDGHSSPDFGKEDFLECEGSEFSVVDQGIEYSSNEHDTPDESIIKPVVDAHSFDSSPTLDAVKEDSQDELSDSYDESSTGHEIFDKKDDLCTKELLLQEIESALNNVCELETVAMESPNVMEAKSGCKMARSHSLDDVESVASEFFSILGIEHSPMDLSSESEPESPRERLLRQFEKDALSEGFSLFDFDMGSDEEQEEEEDSGYDASFGSEKLNFPKGIKLLSSLQDQQEEHLIESKDVRSKQKGQVLEDLETEALMREWGLNEKAFQHSPPKDSSGFGSPIHLLPEKPVILPSLAEGLGPSLQTKNGGFLRSMNPALFKNAKSGGSLILQVSNPVVVPAEMGSGITEILQCLASLGIEKLSMQANKLMPLEDITGKTMQQISWEAMPVLEGTDRQSYLRHDLVTGQDSTRILTGLKGTLSGVRSGNKFSSSSVGNQIGLVSLEDLAPLAMDKIEALSLEGLRIQSGMSEEDAPSNIIAQSFGDISTLQDKGVNVSGSCGSDGAAALQLLDMKDSNTSIDGIMGLSLRLDEWMKLDSGQIDDIDNISEHTSKLLAAHHANSFDLIRGSSKGEKKRGKDKKCGLLGNNVTIALMVQLHDPLRNYEPVGTPMLALVQVERVFVPPKQKIYMRVSEVRNDNDKEDECEIVAKVELKDDKEDKSSKEEVIPQFRITEIHVAGLKTEPSKKKLWGSSSQQQSGSRWLLANGMGKGNKNNQIVKSKAASKSSVPVITKVQPGDTLWSISSRIYGTGAKWKELVALNPHIRNPNIIIRNETLRIR
ncbi:protein PLASTID MOVEMENT IMPAIRED 1-RELATED 1-like [Lotus japonicus]|uniref:protein PLASTID MOVEMENT IMPAIRED 1-RELATED 1-like n=1 Tax=Lotus japonicus TaxID=34305 RepID=UPI00258DEB5B|nr:protein PLASTID MOVEMENT IMPAIRED 1-RELATED 1-like [Lotus japonicus]